MNPFSRASYKIGLERYGNRFENSADGKLCSMFMFSGVEHPDVLHVTHKYFGKSAGDLLPKILAKLNSYFTAKPFQSFTPKFDRVEMFGENKEVRVLTGPAQERKMFLLDLKQSLDELKVDTYPDYLPHASVSDNVDRLNIPIVDYVLVQDGDIVFRASEVSRR